MGAGDGIPNYGGLLADQLQSYPDVGGLPMSAYANANVMAGGATDILREGGAADQAAARRPDVSQVTTKIDKDGQVSHKYEISDAAHQWVQQMIGIAQSAIAEKTALNSRLAAKRDVLEKHPALAEIGQILSLAATAYQAPNSRGAPLVHAAGAYAGSYFQDTPESLQAQIAQNEAAKVGIAAPIYSELATQERLQHQQETEDAREKARDARIDETRRRDTLQAIDQRIDSATQQARQLGAYTPGEITQSILSTAGDTPENRSRAAAAEATIKTAALAYDQKQKQTQTDKLDYEKQVLQLHDQYDKASEGRRFEIEKKLIEERAKQGLKGADAVMGRIGAVEDDERKSRFEALKGMNQLQSLQQQMIDAHVPGYTLGMTPSQLTTKLSSDLGKRELDAVENGKPVKKSVLEIIGAGNDSDVAAARSRVSAAGASYQLYKESLPNLISQHNELRKLLKAKTNEDYPEMIPTAKGVAASSPANKPAPLSLDDVNKMSLPELQAAAKSGRTVAPQDADQAKAIIAKKKQPTAVSPSAATGTTTLDNVLGVLDRASRVGMNSGGASGRY